LAYSVVLNASVNEVYLPAIYTRLSISETCRCRSLNYFVQRALTYAKITYVEVRTCLSKTKLECGPMANVMATPPNVGGALCSTPQTLADAHYSSAVQ